MANGGIIGPLNIPTSTTATGVWQQEEQYEAKVTDTWPQRVLFTTKSLRFNPGSSDYLTESVSSTSNRRTFTYSAWIKRSSLSGSGYPRLFNPFVNSANFFDIFFRDTDALNVYSQNADSNDMNLVTNRLFRDFSAWYHIVVAVDTTQGTAANRVKLYVNGTQETSFSAATYPSQNTDFQINLDTVTNVIGRNQAGSDNYFDGYMSEVIFIDGQQLAPTSFGVANSDGVWTPIIYSGTYGTNGFNLQFENAAALGTDSSPNGNTFTVNNLTSIDQSTDYPEVNYATANPLTLSTDATLTEGNLAITYGTASTRRAVFGTVAMFNGKWFWETKITATSQTAVEINLGISNTMNPELTGNALVSNNGFSVSYFTGGYIYIGTTQSQTGLGNLAVNDVIGCALDLTANTIQFYKNGSTLGSAASLTSQTTGELGGGDSGGWTPAWSCSSGGQTFTAGVNFGSPSFAISSGNADGNGYGNFEYAVPSGFYAINTANLAEFG
jgi:hypothetical protein